MLNSSMGINAQNTNDEVAGDLSEDSQSEHTVRIYSLIFLVERCFGWFQLF